jgi:hypothetical protein
LKILTTPSMAKAAAIAAAVKLMSMSLSWSRWVMIPDECSCWKGGLVEP